MVYTLILECAAKTELTSQLAADSIISTVRERDTFSGYAPTTSDCPSSDRPVLRDSLSTSSQELSWLKKRRANTVPALREFLGRLNITGFNSNSYIDNARNTSQLPNIAIAVSGGGYRALMNGAGAIAAFDNRTLGSIASGHLGGLLQSTTYLAGLSGGGWLLSSLYGNEFPTVEEILSNERANPLWQFQNPIWIGPDLGDTGTSNAEAYFEALLNQVQSKADAGFNTSMTDLWGRAIAYQLLNTTNIDNCKSKLDDNVPSELKLTCNKHIRSLRFKLVRNLRAGLYQCRFWSPTDEKMVKQFSRLRILQTMSSIHGKWAPSMILDLRR